MRRSFVSVLSIFSMLAASLCVSSCVRRSESITLGTIGGIKDTLVFVAIDEGYFRRNDLEIELKIYANGVAAVEGLLKGEVDLAYGSEYVSVQQAFKKADLRILAVEARWTGTFVVGRKDRGIQAATGLKGKKVGVKKERFRSTSSGCSFGSKESMSGRSPLWT